MQVERITFRRDHPRPAFQSEHEYPHNEEETQMLTEWSIGWIDDLIDESVRFIDSELNLLNLNPQQRENVREKIKIGVISVWAEWHLDMEDEVPIDQEVIAQYLKHKFNIDVPVCNECNFNLLTEVEATALGLEEVVLEPLESDLSGS
ncbi:MAG: hypothetical protein HYW77_01565 [Parcubacteria group bacterium]|nr:hypothetical protein [Parcubacteria group bacterium]